jgi:hypothetical protein
MTRAHREAAKAKLCKHLADRTLVQCDAEASFNLVAQINRI